MPWLHEVRIIDWNIKSVEPLNCLKEIRSLEVSTYCDTIIDFEKMPQLRDCGFEWRPGSNSIFKCKNIEKLFINSFGEESFDFSQGLRNLEDLDLRNSNITSLDSFRSALRLKSLRLVGAGRLRSLSGLEGLHSLKKLEVEYCKLCSDIDFVNSLKSLEFFNLSDNHNINSLKPLEHLYNLQTLLFFGSTNINDGKLRFLLDLKNLQSVRFKNRRHYDARVSEFN